MDALLTINTVYDNATELYRDRIPVATESNMKDIGIMLTSQDYEPQKNEFCKELFYKIMYKDARNRLWKNHLAVLKGPSVPYGGVKEVSHTNPIKGKNFKDQTTDNLLKSAKADVKTVYFTRNRQDMYEVSVSDAELRTAFTSPAEFNKFYESKITALYSGDNMDEYHLMRNTISDCVTEGKIPTIEVDFAGKTSDALKTIEKISRDFKYQKVLYAGYNYVNKDAIEAGTLTPCITWCPRDKQVLILREDIDVDANFDVLANAFNEERVDFKTRKVFVDAFSDPDILCVLADESFFEFYDNEYTMRTFDNGSNLTMKYMLHHWETIQLNALANAVAFKQKAQA